MFIITPRLLFDILRRDVNEPEERFSEERYQPSLKIWVPALGFTWWQGRIKPCKLVSLPHVGCGTPTNTNKKQNLIWKIETEFSHSADKYFFFVTFKTWTGQGTPGPWKLCLEKQTNNPQTYAEKPCLKWKRKKKKKTWTCKIVAIFYTLYFSIFSSLSSSSVSKSLQSTEVYYDLIQNIKLQV